jgi:hypothetical protein
MMRMLVTVLAIVVGGYLAAVARYVRRCDLYDY